MTPLAKDIAAYLAANGVGVVGGNTGWTIAHSREPAKPPDAITVYDTGGQPPDTDQLDILYPTFQVRVRSDSYEDAFAKHETIRDLLTLPGRFATAGATYVTINMTSDITAIGRDDQDRFLLTANYRAIRERS